MAKIQLTIGALGRSWTIPPEDIQRMLDTIKRNYGQVQDAAEGSPPVLPPPRDRTNAECFDIVARNFINMLKDLTTQSERNVAVSQIVVPPLDVVEDPVNSPP